MAVGETLEIEMKFPVADLAALRERLKAVQARRKTIRPLQESDHYFNAPDRDFAQTDEALRLRRIGAANRVTYKGPKRDKLTKTRAEIEVPMARGEQAAADFSRLLVCLGYRPVRVVSKQRQVYHIRRKSFEVEVCLDRVDGLGSFVELEIVAGADRLDEARSVLLALAAELDLPAPERRSYLQLLLEKEKASGT
ncbi:MAG: class IV adenylate cyclase [Planctomycetia bacterium]|nr:class IV adenylate cyclase [Planctomycetia bacterium]